ncbi:MAG: exo-alpha-sialidase, partial [Pirellulales bacterium]
EAGRRRGGFLLFRSRDGKQWTRGGTMLGGSQPTVIVRDNGELLSLLRHHPRIMTSISSDGGLHWSTSRRTELKNPGSGIAMTKLRPASTAGPIHAGGSVRPPSKAGADRSGGRIVLVFNNTDESDRTPLCLLQSTDDGQTWHGLRRLESDWGEFSYPCILQTSDGKIHISYTYRRYSIKHVTFDEGWLTHEQRPN